MRLQGKVAVVTGGLRGIGYAIALAMAHEGADLLIVGFALARRPQARGEAPTVEVRAACSASYGRRHTLTKGPPRRMLIYSS